MNTPLTQASIRFASRLLLILDTIHDRDVIKNRLFDIIDQVGCSLTHAQFASVKQERIHHLQTALKECRCVSYWLQLLLAANSLPESQNITLQHLHSRLCTALEHTLLAENPPVAITCPMTPRQN